MTPTTKGASGRNSAPARSLDVEAAGVVVFRKGPEVLLVHRPKYDDWAYPKGKLNRGEHAACAAVREVEEETGLTVRLTRPLTGQRYRIGGGRMKTVRYWTGRAVGPDDVSGYQANSEIDDVAWVPVDKADQLLTYDIDRETLVEALEIRKRTTTLVVLRHAEARARSRWKGDDRVRPLLATGVARARGLATLLSAYGVGRVVSSSSARCVDTVSPYADHAGVAVERHDTLSEQDARPKQVRRLVEEIVAAGDNAVICTHRPVLPHVFEALGMADPGLAKGELVVVHLRNGRVVATEMP